ncbi:MAG: ABC transporter permease [Clostridiaceae bacterium]
MNLIKLIKQDIRNLLTNPIVTSYALVYPAVMIVLFGYIFSSLYGGKGVSSYDYYGVTILIYIILNGCTITPNTFMERRIKSGNIRIAFSPTSKWEIYTSKILSTFLFLGSLFSLNMFVLYKIGLVNYGGVNFIFVVFLMLALLLFTLTLGTFTCVLFKSEEVTNKILSLVCNLLALTSGIFFPVDGLGKWVSKISDFSPVKQVVERGFSIIYDNSFRYYNVTLFSILVITMLLFIAIHNVYKPEDFI